MIFEWDPKKAAVNLEKHGISFKEATEIFSGPIFTFEDVKNDYGEKRLLSIGQIASVVVVIVTHTDRAGRVRIISARKASRMERKKYHEYLKEAG